MQKSLLYSVAGILLSSAVMAKDCTLDKLIFRDKQSKREFAVERIAANLKYLCDQTIVATSKFRPDLAHCSGPYGQTIFEGYLVDRI